MNRVFGLLLLMLVSAGVFAQNDTWYAITSGEWSNEEIWTLDPAASVKVNPAGEIPDETDNVVIKSGRTITMDADGYKANALTVDGRLELKETNGHQFSQIRGSGRIIMEGDNFPAGDATHFTSKNQGEGTVVFKGSSFTFSSGNTFFNLDVEMEAAQGLTLGADVVLNGNLTVRSGSFQFGNNTTSRNLVVKGDISVLSGASITVSEINATHQLEIFGNITNNGLIKLTNLDQPIYNSSSTNGSVTLKASGASNSTLSANNTTFLQRLVIEKGTDRTYRLTVNSSNKDNFRLFGRNNNSVAEKALYINKGTLELTGDLYIHSLTEGGEDFTIPVDGGLWINGENVEVHTTAVSNDAGGFTSVGVAAAANGNKSFSVKGLFKITDGELNTHTHGFVAWNDGNSLVEIAGGKIYSPGFRSAGTQDGKWTYYQSGGEVYLYGDLGSDLSGSGAATFSVKGVDNVFIMSDGLLEIQDAATSSNLAIGIESGEGKYNVTGGTIRVNQAAGASSIFNVSTTAPLYNLEIEAGNVQLQSELTVSNQLKVSGGLLDVTDQNYALNIGGGLSKEGTGTLDLKQNTTSFIGANSSILSIATGTLEFYDLIISKNSEEGNVLLATGDLAVNNDLIVESGELKLDNSSLILKGNLSLQKGNVSTTTGKISFQGNSMQTLYSDYGSDYGLGKVELNNSSESVELLSDFRISDLYFASDHMFHLGEYNLKITESLTKHSDVSWGSNTSMFRTNGLSSDGGLTLPVQLSGNKANELVQLFPVGILDGIDTRYTRGEVYANGNDLISDGMLTMNPVNDFHPTKNEENEDNILDFYWQVSAQQLDGLKNNLRYNFVLDKPINVSSLFIWFREFPPKGYVFTNGRIDEFGQNVKVGSYTLSFPYAAELTNDFTYGVFEADGWLGTYIEEPRTLYSRNNADSFNWNDRDTWSESGHNGGSVGNNEWPQAGDIVIIGNGHRINVEPDNNGGFSNYYAGEIIFDHDTTISTSFEDIPRLQIGRGNNMNLGKVSGTGMITQYIGANRNSNIYGDLGAFANEKYSWFLYVADGADVELPEYPRMYPNVATEGDDRKLTFTKDVTIRGNLNPRGNSTLLLNNGNDGDIVVRGDLLVGDYLQGVLEFPADDNDRIVTVEGNIDFTGTAWNTTPTDDRKIIVTDGTGEATHQLIVHGNIIQGDGEIDLYTSANQPGVELFFSGTRDAFFERSGSGKTEIERIVIEKLPGKQVSFNQTFDLMAVTDIAKKPLTLVSGNTYLNHADIKVLLSTGGDFKIPSEAILTVNKGEVQLGGTDAGVWLDGKLVVNDEGTAKLNQGLNNYIEYTASGKSEIEVNGSGALLVGTQLRRSAITDAGILHFSQNHKDAEVVIGTQDEAGGNIESTRGVFEILNAGSEFTMASESELVIRNLKNGGSSDFYFDSETLNIGQGSTIKVENGLGGSASMDLFVNKPLKNLTVSSGVEANLNTIPLELEGDLTIETGSIFDANGLDVNLYGNLTNSGTFEPSYNTTYFKGDALQTITGNVTLHKVIKEGSGTLTQAEDTEVTINDDLNILSGVVNTAENQLIVKGDLLIESGASTQSSSTTDGVVMAGSNSQLLQVAGEIGRLSVNNASGVVVPTQGGAINFTSQLKLDAGVLDIGRNLLVVGKGAEIVSGTSGFSEDAMIQTNLSFTDAGVQKFLPAITSPIEYTIPIGSMGKYTPVVLNVSTTGNATGSIRVKAANEPHITIPASEKNRVLQYNWTLDADGVEDFSANVTMQAFADAVNGDGSSYITARLLDASEGYWNKYNLDGFDENNYVLNFNFEETDDAGIDGDFTAGEEDAIPEKVQTFVTRSNGLWNDASTWRVEGSGVVPSGGPRGAIVKINHKVGVPTSTFSAAAYMTELGNAGTLDFGSTFGHRLGKVKGTGRIILQRNALPAGMYDEFFSKNGGTLEFTGDTDYDVLGEITLVNNLALTGSGERRLGAADLTLNGGLTVDTISLINESEIDLSLKGNLSFNNGLFDIRNGLVTFDGAQQQNVGGLSALSGNNALTSAIVKNGNGISLSNDLEVSKTMTINIGNVVSTNSSALIISNPSLTALQLKDANTFIGTTLRKQLTANDSYDFRVGKDDRSATLNLSSLDASGLWEVEYFNSNPANSTPSMNPGTMSGTDLKFVSHNEYWRVKAPTAANAGVTVRWDEQSGFSTESAETQKLRMTQWTSSNAWSMVDGIVYHNEGASFGTIESNNAVGFNEISGKGNFFTIGSIEKYLYDWTGNLNSDWFNAGNWDDGKVPTSNTEVTIGVVSSLPEIGLNSEKDAYALDLTINPNATVTLQPGATLNVSGSFVNNGDVILKSNPNAVAALNVPVDNADSGHGTIELSGIKADQWYRFGQPIADATGAIYKASGDKSWVYRSTTNWERIQSDTEIIHPMEGIMVLYDQDETLTYGGQLNTGEINWKVPYGRGYYLFSNPYPGSMRWDISNPNTGITVSDNVSSTIYYRVYAGSVEDDYMITYNGFSGFSTLVDGESMPGGYTTSNIGNISPMQSVWVKVNDSDQASITVDNRARVSDNSLPLKSTGNNSDRDVIRIVQSNDYISDVAVVYFDDYFQEGLDRSDSEKMMNSSKYIPEIFSRVDNKNLAINGLPSLVADQLSIPLSVRIREKGEVAISMVLDDFTEDYEVWLEDLELENQINMRDVEQYTYEWNNSGYNHNRFVMHLIRKVEVPTGFSDPEEPEAGKIMISGHGDYALVKISPDLLADGNAEIIMMDLNGRQVSSSQAVSAETEIQLPDATGVYLIKVTAKDQQKTVKVMKD
jgi:hypothetical protein